jgi:hypothetical protein
LLVAPAPGEEPVVGECARNLAGLSGLALLAARFIGARLSWAAPVFYATVAPFVVRGPDGTWAWLAWAYLPSSDALSWALALALLALGLASAAGSVARPEGPGG